MRDRRKNIRDWEDKNESRKREKERKLKPVFL